MTTPAFAEIEENFTLLDEWEDRYRYLIDLGRAMAPLPEALHTEGARVHGCASRVWLIPRLEGGRLFFDGDSDALIVRGLIAVLGALINGRPAAEIATTDVASAFARLGLERHLSAQRSNGLRAMVARVREVAATAAAA